MADRFGQCPRDAGRATPGFTLIELLVVIAIVAMLIGLILPALAESRDAARTSVCLSRLHNLHLATRIYADHYRTFPVEDPRLAIEDFELPQKVWRCPTDQKNMSNPDPQYSSYSYLAPIYMDPPASGLVLSQLKPWVAYRKYENNPLLPLFWDVDEWHDKGRNVVYWNGSVRRKDW